MFASQNGINKQTNNQKMDINIDKITVNVINVTVQNPKSENKTDNGNKQAEKSNIVNDEDDEIIFRSKVIDSINFDS